MEEFKSKIATQFKILERSEKDGTKLLARNKDSEVRKHVSYIEQLLDTIKDMKHEVQEMKIGDKVEDAIVDESINITNKKMERYQELVDRLKGCLEDLREWKEAEIRKKEDEMQEERFTRRMEEELKIEEMKMELKKKNEDKDIIVNRNIQVKLPRLLITKFEGTIWIGSNFGFSSKRKLIRLRLVL